MACLAEEQEEFFKPKDDTPITNVDKVMTATTANYPTNMVMAHWARKLNNRKLRKMGMLLDTGATSGAAPEADAECFCNTGKASTKIFMFPDK